jgi:hypothetical protein
MTEDEVTALGVATYQQAIGHYHNGMGNLWGPEAASWGDFNPEFFKVRTYLAQIFFSQIKILI